MINKIIKDNTVWSVQLDFSKEQNYSANFKLKSGDEFLNVNNTYEIKIENRGWITPIALSVGDEFLELRRGK